MPLSFPATERVADNSQPLPCGSRKKGEGRAGCETERQAERPICRLVFHDRTCSVGTANRSLAVAAR